jgi:hypothetical protein
MSVLGRHQRWRKRASVFVALQATATGGDDISSTARQQPNNYYFSATSDVMLSANSTPAFQQQCCLHTQQQFVNSPSVTERATNTGDICIEGGCAHIPPVISAVSGYTWNVPNVSHPLHLHLRPQLICMADTSEISICDVM